MNNKIQKGNVGQVKPDVKISMSCRKASIRHLRIFVFDEMVNKRKEKRRSPTETLGDDRPLCYNRINAFTLIELLVVVLIIGILAAVAVPQYQKAVERTKSTEAVTMLKSVYQAAQEYYLANGTWPTTFAELSISPDWTGNTKWSAEVDTTDALSNNTWSLQMQNYYEMLHGISIGKISGKYVGGGFIMWNKYAYNDTFPQDTILCVEKISEIETAGDYCRKIMNSKQLFAKGSTLRYYKI